MNYLGYKPIPMDDQMVHEERIRSKFFSIIHKFASVMKWETDLKMDNMIMETMLLLHGAVGTKDGEAIGWLVPSDIFDKITGMPTKWNITYLDGTTENDVPAEDLCICLNMQSWIKTDIIMFHKAAKMLADIDLSEVCNVIYSRNLPIPVVDDDIDKNQIEKTIADAIKGKISIVTKSIINKLKHNKEESIELLPIFNVKSSENLQDLSRFCEEMEKRLMAEIGINISSNDKKAQLTSEELNNMDEYSFISVYDRLNQRKKFCKEVNERFGKSWTVEHLILGKMDSYNKEESHEETTKGDEENEENATDRNNAGEPSEVSHETE